MARIAGTGLLALLLLAGCGGDDDIETGPGAGPGAVGPVAAPETIDLSTPESAVRAFCGAAAARDPRTMGFCVAEAASEKDLRRIALGQLSEDEVEELSSLALGTVDGTEVMPDGNEAVVSVTFASGRRERITVVRTPGGWKVDDS